MSQSNNLGGAASSTKGDGPLHTGKGAGVNNGFREAAEHATSNAQSAYGRMQVASDKATGVMQETYSIAGDHVAAMALKGLDIAKANADASFDLFRSLIGAKTLNEAIGLQAAYAQTLFGTFTGQVKDFQDAVQKAAAEVTGPSRSAWENGSKQHKAT